MILFSSVIRRRVNKVLYNQIVGICAQEVFAAAEEEKYFSASRKRYLVMWGEKNSESLSLRLPIQQVHSFQTS